MAIRTDSPVWQCSTEETLWIDLRHFSSNRPSWRMHSSFLVSRNQSRLAVGIHPEVLMPRVNEHLVQPRCRDDGLDSRLMSAQRGHQVRRAASTAI